MKNINNNYLLKDAIIITPFRTIEGYNLFVEEGKITRIVKKNILISDVKKFKILDLKPYNSTPDTNTYTKIAIRGRHIIIKLKFTFYYY